MSTYKLLTKMDKEIIALKTERNKLKAQIDKIKSLCDKSWEPDIQIMDIMEIIDAGKGK